jgi:NAD(P)-dependent dehydrogenase (short-subunit alcohol dehydrogenase family)
MDLGIEGQKILITGASQGIGAGLAVAFAEERANLHLVARNQDKLVALAEQIKSRYRVQVSTQAVDITKSGSIDEIVAAAGEVDVLINNAGAIPGGDLWAVDAAQWRKGWDLKVYGYIDLTRVYYSLMKARGRGVILNNIGNGGENLDFNYIAGSAGNASLMAFTRAIGSRSAEDGIRVIGINPGPVATDRIFKALKVRAAERLGDEDRYMELAAAFPFGRPAKVQEIADTFVFLASPRSSYTSGTIVTIDGGITSRRSV